MIGGVAWWKIGCLGMVVMIALGFAALHEFVGYSRDAPIDGMECGAMMNGYHVHAHLSLYDAGNQVFLYGGIGWSQQGKCWYWLHTHDGSGVIHVEGPDGSFNPTLGKFFDIWRQPLSRRQFLAYKVGAGQTMRIYVNLKPVGGSPRAIPLRRHATITLEIGPPFLRPQTYKFGTL
jgi:hypothetical protein